MDILGVGVTDLDGGRETIDEVLASLLLKVDDDAVGAVVFRAIA
jgi:hypothetical protein